MSADESSLRSFPIHGRGGQEKNHGKFFSVPELAGRARSAKMMHAGAGFLSSPPRFQVLTLFSMDRVSKSNCGAPEPSPPSLYGKAFGAEDPKTDQILP